jgi:addiction module HigA family antidote
MAVQKKKMEIRNPCDVIQEEMDKRFLNQTEVAKGIGVSGTTIMRTLKNKRLSYETALRLAKYFGYEKDFLVDMKVKYEISQIEKDLKFLEEYKKIKPLTPVKAVSAKRKDKESGK